MHEIIKKAIESVESWCDKSGIRYNVLCGENDVQGIVLFKSRNDLSDLQPVLKSLSEGGVYHELNRVRGGTIISLSMRAISEADITILTAEADKVGNLHDKLAGIFEGEITPQKQIAPPVTDLSEALMATAAKIHEDQYKTSTGNLRLSQSSRPDAYHPDNVGNFGGIKKSKMVKLPPKKDKPKFRSKLTDKIDEALRTVEYKHVMEALDDMAAEFQPNDLFQAFGSALQSLGQAMGGRPLQDQLKDRGIKWKTTDDGQAIIFYVINGETKAQQPIGMITADSLQKPNEFQEELTTIIDYVRGEAPGTEKARREQVRDTEKQIRDIATQHSPQQKADQASPQQLAQQQVPPVGNAQVAANKQAVPANNSPVVK